MRPDFNLFKKHGRKNIKDYGIFYKFKCYIPSENKKGLFKKTKEIKIPVWKLIISDTFIK